MPRVVSCRERAVRVVADGKRAGLVSQEDVATVLCGALPVGAVPEVASLIHEIKLWGKEWRFDDSVLGWPCSGEAALSALLNDNVCAAYTAGSGGHLLLDSPYGIRVTLAGSDDAVAGCAEAHLGQLLGGLVPAVDATYRTRLPSS